MFSDDQISAYLDGELSAEERTQLEKALKENDQLRELCDELRQLRERLAALPRYRLREGFDQRVLRRAERVMLSAQAVERPAPARAATARLESDRRPDARAPAGRRRVLRALAAACAALAASLVIAVVATRMRRTALVQAPRPAAGSADAAAEREPAASGEPAEALSAPAAAKADLRFEKHARMLGEAETASAPAAANAGGFQKAKPEEEEEAKEESNRPRRGAAALHLKGAGPERFDSSSKLGKSAGGGEPAARLKSAPAPRAARGRINMDKTERFAPKAAAPPPSASFGRRSEDRAGGGQETAEPVVRIDAAPEAVSNRLFEQALAANQIALEIPQEEQPAGRPSGPAKSSGAEQQAAPTNRAADQAEVVLVEATVSQVSGALADLARQSDQFPVMIESSTGQNAQVWLSQFVGLASSSGARAPRVGEAPAEEGAPALGESAGGLGGGAGRGGAARGAALKARSSLESSGLSADQTESKEQAPPRGREPADRDEADSSKAGETPVEILQASPTVVPSRRAAGASQFGEAARQLETEASVLAAPDAGGKPQTGRAIFVASPAREQILAAMDQQRQGRTLAQSLRRRRPPAPPSGLIRLYFVIRPVARRQAGPAAAESAGRAAVQRAPAAAAPTPPP